MQLTPIHQVQGQGLFSEYHGQVVALRGVVTGATRKGYFVQDPEGDIEGSASHGIFIFERKHRPPVGSLVQVEGKVVNYEAGENGRPTTQVEERETRVIAERGPEVKPLWLTAERVLVEPEALASLLNSLEGMLVGVPAGATFVAPSNPFGDYVLLPPDAELVRTDQGGVLIDPDWPGRWLPGFRILNYAEAPLVHVGAKLMEPVLGPLNFRASSYQIASAGPVRVSQAPLEIRPTSLQSEGTRVRVLTLNGFNLDAHKERADQVTDPRRDVDDDVGDGRFAALAKAIVRDAANPEIVALQEIQDGDGAELSATVSAEHTLEQLIGAVRRAGGVDYAWADIPPEMGEDGGQPGGNIRNAYLYDPAQVVLVEGSLQRLGDGAECFDGSRKPLVARFRPTAGAGELELINVHLASKRHQHSLFAPEQPGFDPRLGQRVAQVEVIGVYLAKLRAAQVDYYVTGDFNDFEFSETLRTLVGDHSANLVERVPLVQRYDYNHRGLSQALMHGVVSKRQLEGRTVQYEILHANALEGIQPGRLGAKASDHAYVIASLELG
ncbi:MAG: putative extracellular nuclease [Planctomycetota bacterium]